MHLNAQQIQALPLKQRIMLINAITGIKPANLIGTIDTQGQTNLALFSSVVHLGSQPPLIGFVLRPLDDTPRHTYQNILQTGCYTINHVHTDFAQQAHLTSGKFAKQQSEFAACQLTEHYLPNFAAPFVQESHIKYGLTFVEEMLIKHNNTRLIIGEISEILVQDHCQTADGGLDLQASQSLGISGLNGYYELKHLATFAQVK
jgi:flavin reductase (DIM6/NTAB) family NADH-FMN oxidoreductase RutF